MGQTQQLKMGVFNAIPLQRLRSFQPVFYHSNVSREVVSRVAWAQDHLLLIKQQLLFSDWTVKACFGG